jgi:hypothetical protein
MSEVTKTGIPAAHLKVADRKGRQQHRDVLGGYGSRPDCVQEVYWSNRTGGGEKLAIPPEGAGVIAKPTAKCLKEVTECPVQGKVSAASTRRY